MSEESRRTGKRPKLDPDVRNALFDSSSSSDPDSSEDFATDFNRVIWHETQIAECVIDNTVNRVMESYRSFLRELDELATDQDNREDIHISDDEDESVEPRESLGGGQVEESAILMAITEHGLRHPGEEDEEGADSTSNSASIGHVRCGGLNNEPNPDTDDNPDLNFLAISTAIQSKGLSPTQSIQIPPHR